MLHLARCLQETPVTCVDVVLLLILRSYFWSSSIHHVQAQRSVSSALGSASEDSVFECAERWIPEHKALRASNHWCCLVGGNACRFSSKPGRLDGKTDSWENLPNHAMTPGGHKALSSMRVRCSKWHGMAVQIVPAICLAIRAPRLEVDAGFAHIAAKWAAPMIAGPRGPVLRDPALED